MSWIWITVGAAAAQAVRTALQKQLAGQLDALTVTWVRFLFGLPFALGWAAFCLARDPAPLALAAPILHLGPFYFHASLAALSQILATLLLIWSFRLCNFAVATTYARTEAIQVALIGVLVFQDTIPLLSWGGILVTAAGTLVMSLSRRGGAESSLFDARSACTGLGAGLGFAIASYQIREASHLLSVADPVPAAALTLAVVVVLQTLVLALPVLWQPGQWQGIRTRWPICTSIGLGSALGSAGWFTAMSMVSPAFVKSLAQVEFLFVLLISVGIFRERIRLSEWTGMLAVAAGILLLLTGIRLDTP